MNGISIPNWLAYVFYALATTTLVTFVVWVMKRNERLAEERAARLRQVPGTPFWCDAAPDFDVARLGRACNLALECLDSLWPRALVLERLKGWVVKLSPTETWKTQSGATVGGECWPQASTIQVGPSLAVLAHELAHACESALDRKIPDEAHATWAQRGVWQADTTYRTRWGKE